MDPLRFDTRFEFEYGQVARLSPLVRRVVAPNPGPYTFHGTSTFIVGNGQVAVIDPGPDLPGHVDAIVAALDGETVSHILVTHTHLDHSPASAALQQMTGAPTLGFGPHGAGRSEAARSGGDTAFAPDLTLVDGDKVQGPDWSLEAIHTPGHCSNHLCFALPEENTLFCGDQVMAWSTTVILPPDGGVGEYLESLSRLRDRPETLYRPTHGAAIHDPGEWVERLMAHRRSRVEQVCAAVASGVQSIAGIREIVYKGLDARLHGGAERTILGSLEYLVEKGRVGYRDGPTAEAGYVIVD